jgi:hypothetical protein
LDGTVPTQYLPLISQIENFPNKQDLLRRGDQIWEEAKELVDQLRKDHLYDPDDHYLERKDVKVFTDGSIYGPVLRVDAHGITEGTCLIDLDDPELLKDIYGIVMTLKWRLQAHMSLVNQDYDFVMWNAAIDGVYLGDDGPGEPVVKPEYRHLLDRWRPQVEPTQDEETPSSSSTDIREDE